MPSRFRISFISITGLIIVLISTLGFPSAVLSASGDGTTAGTVSVIPTFESIGVRATYTGDNNQNNSAVLQYRKSGGAWKTAPAMYADRENHQYRGSIFWLTPRTQYEVKVTFNDVDGGATLSTSTTTRDDSPAIGTDYLYVSKSGNDSTGDGSISKPWRTIQKASNNSHPGNTILVRAGTYSEEVDIAVSGTASNYITYMPYPGETVILDGNQSLGRLFFLYNIDYIRIKGFTIRNTVNEPAIYIDRSSDYIIVEGNTITNCNVGGDRDYGCIQLHSERDAPGPTNSLIQNNVITMNVPGQENVANGIGIWRLGPGHVFRNNTITSPNWSLRDGIGGGPEGEEGFMESSDVYNNVISGAYDDCIQIEGSDANMRIWNNRVEAGGTSTGDKIGIATCPVLEGPCYVFRNVIWMHTNGVYDTGTKMGDYSWGRLYYLHNTFYIAGGTSAGNGLSQTNNGLANTVSRNNIVYCTRYVMEISTNDPEERFGLSNDWDYDFLYTTKAHGSGAFGKWEAAGINDLADLQSRFGRELHGISVANVKLVNPASGDFNLQAGSPCIDAGTILPGFNDADSPWPYSGSAPDMGAYEWNAGGPMPPVLAPIGNKTAHPGFTLQFTISATDPNGSSGLVYSANNLPSGATFNPATRTFSWSPTAGQVGTYPGVHFEVTDGDFIDSEDITIYVVENQAPILTNPGNKTGSEGSPLPFTLSASDPDGDPLTYSGSNLPSGASVNPNTGAFSWTPNYNQAGTYPNVRFTVSDGQLTDSKNITIIIQNSNQPPVLASIGNKAVNEGQTLQFTVSATDPEGDPLTYSASNLPVGASFDGTSRLFAWTPVSTQKGTYPGVHFEVTDGRSIDYENITITVGEINTNPSSGDGGGGGDGSGGGSGGGDTTTLTGMMNGEGEIVIEVLCTVNDLAVEIIIPKETTVKCRDGSNARYIRIKKLIQATRQAQYCQVISACYDILPDGVTFEPAATIIFRYDKNKIPEGISENSLYIAEYDPDTETWTKVGGTVDLQANTVSAQIEHLSRYALLASMKPASFELAYLSISQSEIMPGETVAASVTICNQGDICGTCPVELMLDNDAMQSEDIEIAGGGTVTVTFTLTSDVPGVHYVNIGNSYGAFYVVEPKSPAAFTVSGLNIVPDSVNAGEIIRVSSLITNTGELTGSYPAVLKINDTVMQTKEVTLEGGEAITVIFGVTLDTYGRFTVSIGDLEGSFEVKPEPPPLFVEASNPPEINSFSTALNYDKDTNKLVYANITYQISQTYYSIPNNKLIMAVYYNDELLEQIPLLGLSQLQADGRTGQLNYVPSEGWKTGEYSFQAELYEGEDLIQCTPLKKLTVTPESTTKIISWWTLGAVIGVAMLLIITFVSITIYRRRDMLKYE
jgi:hypothetical protein